MSMAKTVEISDELHEALQSRARAEGVSVAEYLAQTLMTRGRITSPEVMETIRKRSPVKLGIDAAELIREGREERAQQIDETWLSSMHPR